MPLRLEAEEANQLQALFNLIEPARQSDGPTSNIRLADTELCLAHAKGLIEQRRHRDSLFGAFGRFGEPEWEILLTLYVAHAELIDVRLSQACAGTMLTSVTTALRYLSLMVEQEMLESYQVPTDQKRTYMRLSKKSATLMNHHLSHLVQQAA